jgi:hypothetical protein
MQIHRLTTLLLCSAGATAGCAAEAPAPAEHPATCAELQVGRGLLPDAEYTLYLDNDPTRPWRAHCQDMATSTPREYLPLRRTGGDYNYGQFIYRVESSEEQVRTSYLKVRIDPVLMQIDIGDRTHVHRTGTVLFGGVTLDAMAFGVAAYCTGEVIAVVGGSLPRAAGNIDLAETGFALADTFCVHNTTAGYAVPSMPDRGRIDFAAVMPSATSACAWVAPDPCPVDPWRPSTGGGLLDIEYVR